MTAGWWTELPVRGRPVLVVGGGPEALGRIASLRGAGAAVTVVAPAVSDAITDLADRGLIRWHPRTPTDADIAAAWLVVAATGDAEADRTAALAAEDEGRFCLTGTGKGTATGTGTEEDGDPKPSTGTLGRVILVGGGPGDPGLLTLSGLAAIERADVVLVDRLAPLAILDRVRPGTEIVDVAKIPRGGFTPQEEINRLLVTHARAGKTVVRLKGGDIFVFGRGGEEWQACVEAGVPVELIPGVSSSIAAPALAGIPVTHRNLTQGFTVVSGHLPPGDPGSTLDWAGLARSGTTLVILMGVRNLAAICAALQADGLDPATPAATIADAGLPGQRSVRAPLSGIAEATRTERIVAPAVVVIGAVAGFHP